MLFIDSQYPTRLAPWLKNFKQVKPYAWVFSCPLCGDMSKGRQKARGYLYRPGNANHINYKCFHCSASMSMGTFMKDQFPEMYKEYVLQRYSETSVPHVAHRDIRKVMDVVPKAVPNVEIKDAALDNLKSCAELKDSHPVAKYLNQRMIPRDRWNLLFYSLKFVQYVNSQLPKKFDPKKVEEHPRLVIPYFNAHGKMFAFQGRAFDAREPKYITIKLDEDAERIYGLERLDYSKRIYCTEGPIDSLFLPNAIAVSGSSFDSPTMQALKTNLTIVQDNEPRSREIVKIIKKNIDMGYSVCMLPHSVQEKDINDMVKAGYTTKEIHDMIDANTFKGAEALLKFTQWKLI